MLSENEKRIKELCQELGQCLYEQSQIKKFNNLGEIEETVRDLMIHYVNPEIGIFLSNKHRRNRRSDEKSEKHFGGITNYRKTSEEVRSKASDSDESNVREELFAIKWR